VLPHYAASPSGPLSDLLPFRASVAQPDLELVAIVPPHHPSEGATPCCASSPSGLPPHLLPFQAAIERLLVAPPQLSPPILTTRPLGLIHVDVRLSSSRRLFGVLSSLPHRIAATPPLIHTDASSPSMGWLLTFYSCLICEEILI
jgi:hypothetical protein